MSNRLNNSSSKRSIISASIRTDILKILKNSENPVSTQELGSKINRAWHSIQNHCLRLQLDNEIEGFKVGNMNLWRIKQKNTK